MEGFKTVVRQSIDLHLEDQVALDYTLDIGASTDSVTVSSEANILDLRLSYLRYGNFISPTNTNVNLAAFGSHYSNIAPQLSDQVYPNISITNNITQPYAQAVTTTSAKLNNYVFSGSYSKILGRHSITIGGEARQREEYFSLLPIGIDQLPDQYDGLSTAAISALAPAAGAPAGAATVGAYSLRPYSSFQNVSAISPYYGDSYYNSFQATVNKRFNCGGTILGNFSWTKNLSNSESTNAQVELHPTGVIQDYTNLRAERSYLSFDVPYRVVVSYILDLPMGKGKRFLGQSAGVVNTLVSGFNVSGINTIQDGTPQAVIATNNSLATVYGGGTTRPNVVAGCQKCFPGLLSSRAKAGLPTLNAACFFAPAATSFGNEPRTDGQLRNQGVDNWDFSVGKTTPINERVAVVFRAEAFNVINHNQFGDPNLTNSSSQFGIITQQANSPRLFQFSLRLNY